MVDRTGRAPQFVQGGWGGREEGVGCRGGGGQGRVKGTGGRGDGGQGWELHLHQDRPSGSPDKPYFSPQDNGSVCSQLGNNKIV